MTRRLLWSLLAAGLVVLVAVPSVWLVTRPDRQVGRVERLADDPDVVSSTAPASDTSTPTEAAPLIGEELLKPGGDAWVFEPDRRPHPVAVRIPALEVATEVVALGVDAETGQMEVPTNAQEVAWYRHGPRPGEPGSAVLAAHVDYAGRPGVFYRLGELELGAVVEVDLSDGSTRRFVVEARAVFTKEEVPLERIFAREGEAVLTLVTCGGGFNRTERSYDSNVVVVAVPVDPPEEAA